MSSITGFENELSNIKKIIDEGMTFAVMPHIHPDGDGIGSSIALCEYLVSLGKESYVVINETVPQYLDFIAKGYTVSTHSLTLKGFKNPDCVFILDSGDLSRIEDRMDLFNSSKKSVLIDHHLTNERFADVNVVNIDSSSTAEIIYDMLKSFCYEMSETAKVAIYTAVSSDTGSFRYSNTTENTHRVAGEIIGSGTNVADINIELYQNKPLTSFHAMKIALNNMELMLDQRFAISHITLDDLKKYNLKVADTDGLVEMLRDIETVEVSALFREIEKDVYKISLRSKRFVDLTKIASKFGGGGHKRASGCKIAAHISQAKKTLIKAVSEGFDDHDD